MAIFVTLLLSLAAANAMAEPAQFESRDGQTRVFIDFHNRSWLDVDQVEMMIHFYDSTGEEVYRAYYIVDIEVRHQGHREFWVILPDLRRFGPVRAEVALSY